MIYGFLQKQDPTAPTCSILCDTNPNRKTTTLRKERQHQRVQDSGYIMVDYLMGLV